MLVVLGMNIVNVAGNCIVIYRPFGLPDLVVYGIAVSTALSQHFRWRSRARVSKKVVNSPDTGLGVEYAQ